MGTTVNVNKRQRETKIHTLCQSFSLVKPQKLFSADCEIKKKSCDDRHCCSLLCFCFSSLIDAISSRQFFMSELMIPMHADATAISCRLKYWIAIDFYLVSFPAMPFRTMKMYFSPYLFVLALDQNVCIFRRLFIFSVAPFKRVPFMVQSSQTNV